MQFKNNKTLGGILLVAGTCIGAGMIGVPVKTAAAGFYPTIVAFFSMWLLMVFAALLFLEVSLAFKNDTNLLSMIKETLGENNKNIAWIVYLLFMYSIMSAYTTGGVTLVTQMIPLSFGFGVAVFLLPFIYIVYSGPKTIDLVNRFLTIGLIISFVLLCITSIFFSGEGVQNASNFSFIGDFRSMLFALPIIATTFCFQVIIPSLKTYLKNDINSLKKVILIGTTIPLIVYLVWQTVILLLIPIFGDHGLIKMLSLNQNPGDSIINYLMINRPNKLILVFISTFLFCALTTSLLGIAWALFDFLADGLSMLKNKNKNKLFLTTVTFIPPIIYSVYFPSGFLKAVGFAAILSSILIIVYPALMALQLRNKKCIYHPSLTDNINYKAPINNKVTFVIVLLGIGLVVLESINIFF